MLVDSQDLVTKNTVKIALSFAKNIILDCNHCPQVRSQAVQSSDDYYYQLDAAHQREVDWQAGYEIALDEVATEIDNDLKQGDQTHYHELTEMLCDNDNFWLAIGSGASYEPYRQEAIKKIAERELHARMNDYDPDI